MQSATSFRFNEDKNLQEVLEYIANTYGQHYASGEAKHQLMDDIVAEGEDLAFNRWNLVKYAKRYGKKNGFNRDDLLKALHYGILLMYHNDREQAKKEPGKIEIYSTDYDRESFNKAMTKDASRAAPDLQKDPVKTLLVEREY